MGYIIDNISFEVHGPAGIAKRAIQVMFEHAGKPLSKQGLIFQVHELSVTDTARVKAILPQWAIERMFAQEPSEDVILYYDQTPDQYDAAVSIAVDDISIFCCYYDVVNTELHYVLFTKKVGMVPLSVSSVIIPVFAELFAQHSKHLFHAASIYCPASDTGMMMVADSGGGKTTTTLSLLRNGAQMINDDLTLVTQDNQGNLKLSGFAEKMNLTDRTIGFFPEVAQFAEKKFQHEYLKKYPVLPSDIYGENSMISKCRLDVIYFVTVRGSKPSVEPISTAEAFGKLLKANTFAKKQTPSKKRVAQLFSILTSIPVYQLNTGDDPDLLGQWIIDNSKIHRKQQESR